MNKLTEKEYKYLNNRTNRSERQTNFLFKLVNYDFEALKRLEAQIKNCFIFHCPDTKDEVNEILNNHNHNDWFTWDKEIDWKVKKLPR